MEADTIIDAPGFTLPFEFYAGRDFVLLGNPATLRAKDPRGEYASTLLLGFPACSRLPVSPDDIIVLQCTWLIVLGHLRYLDISGAYGCLVRQRPRADVG